MAVTFSNTGVSDAVEVRISGDAEAQRRLLEGGNALHDRALRVVEVLAREVAVAANAAAHRSKRTFKGRRGGRLARSFQVYPRPGWLKIGLVGVAVRSSTRYHFFQEFGVKAPNRQVVRHRDAEGRHVKKSARYQKGTGRLVQGVKVSTYRRDIEIPQHAVLGPVFSRMKAKIGRDLEAGVVSYMNRIMAGGV